MDKQDLLKQLSTFGFPLFEAQPTPDPDLVLFEMFKSKDARLWEGFPVVLADVNQKDLFNHPALLRFLKTKSEKSQFNSLLMLSFALYEFNNLEFYWAKELLKSFPDENKNEFTAFLAKLKNNEEFKVNSVTMSPERLKNNFNNYLSRSQSTLNDLLLRKQEFSLEFALSQVFSPKQKELFLKKLKGEKLTKTEKEYFSRTVKKKVQALANTDLHQLCNKLLDQL